MLLGISSMGCWGWKEGFGKWIFPQEGSAHLSVTRVSPSIHPPSEGLSSSGLKVLPEAAISIISRLQPLQHCPSWSLGIQIIPMGPRHGPQGWKEPLGAEHPWTWSLEASSHGELVGLSASDGPTVVVAVCWSGACKGLGENRWLLIGRPGLLPALQINH